MAKTMSKTSLLIMSQLFSQMLLTSTDSVSQIAAKLDEPDTKSISRRFAAIKGCTPTEYRRKYLRKLGE